MTMKVKVSTIIRYWLLFYALIETGIVGGLGISGNIIQFFTFFSPLCMFLICHIKLINTELYRQFKFVKYSLVIFGVFFMVEYFYTCSMYGLSILSHFWPIYRNYYYWTKLLLVVPIIYLFICDQRIEKVLYSLVNIVFVGNVMRCISWLGKSLAGMSIFPNIAHTITGTREGRLRFGSVRMHTMAFDVACVKVFEQKRNIRWVLIAMFMLGYQFYIANGRSQNLCYIVALMVCAYYSTQRARDNVKTNKAFLIIVVLIGGVMLLSTGTLEAMWNSFFSSTSVAYSSTENRLFAINYYFKATKNKELLGMGLLYDDSAATGQLYQIMRGSSGGWKEAYFEDLGILGQYFNYGMIGVLLCVILLYRMFKIARKMIQIKSSYGPLLMTIFIHVITQTITSMSLFLNSNSLMLPIYVAVFEFLNITQKEVK